MDKLCPESTKFKLARPVFVASGLSTPISEHALKQLNYLSKKLGKKFLSKEFRPLVKKHNGSVPNNIWKASLSELTHIIPDANIPDAYSFGDLIDKEGDTALFYDVKEKIKDTHCNYNTTKILGIKPIREFLFAKAKYGMELQSSAAIYKYMTNEVDGGAKWINDFVVIKSALEIKKAEMLETGTDEAFLNKIAPILKAMDISFSEDIFYDKIKDAITKQLFDKDELEIINKVKDDLNISDEDIPALVNFIKTSKIPIDDDNAQYYLSIAMSNIKNSNISYSQLSSTESFDLDFSVRYYEDDKGTLSFVKENILCSAQLFYVMTLGDELDVFNVMNRIVTKYLPSGQVDIRSKEVLHDLQLYVFNDSFRDLKNGMVFKRTHPEERKMFYKQVFNAGPGDTIEGMPVNADFNRLWETLMTESVKYIQKVEVSENPGLFVSRQNIYQAIEDLQYNLSTHCTGMSKVAAPIINKELDFVIERFLKNQEIIRQLAFTSSGSFWKVIERVLLDFRSEIPNVAALRNKAVFGHKILTTIGNYSPILMENDATFSEFIATIEAFIIANSQLDNRMMEEIEEKTGQEPMMNALPGQDDWNF